MTDKKETILVTGGAGYIGSQVVLDLNRVGYKVVILDNFSTGNQAVLNNLDAVFFEGSTADDQILTKIFFAHKIDAVMHFAAFTQVGESVKKPLLYYQNNVAATLTLLKVMQDFEVNNLIFSSTAAVYGLPKSVPVKEDAELIPINPYGASKRIVEQVLSDLRTSSNFRSVIFRYFNAAGADESGLIGERHDPETHLVPLALMAAAKGTELQIFGNDYDTSDGTCIRDYVHVADISAAHLLGLQHLLSGGVGGIYNIGGGSGYSVNEVITTVEAVVGKKIKTKIVPRRAGDPALLVASSDRLNQELNWSPKYTKLEDIVSSAWNWMESLISPHLPK